MTKQCTTEELKKIHEFAKSLSSDRIRVRAYNDEITLTIDGDKKSNKAAMLALRGKIADHILENYTGRRWFIMQSRGYKVWRWQSEYSPLVLHGLKCGIRCELTDEEDLNIHSGRGLY